MNKTTTTTETTSKKKTDNIFVDRTLIANGKMLRYRCVCAFIENEKMIAA